MKLDWISTLAEVMSYYGTLDQAYRLIRAININTHNIWEKWNSKLSQFIKRKSIQIRQSNIIKLLLSEEEKVIKLLSIFTIESVEIKTLEEYISFIDWINKSKNINLVKIKNLYLHLSSKDNFDWTYKEASTEIIYDDKDREVDEEYNKLVELINSKNVDIENVKSFLYSGEIKNRKIKFFDRAIILIKDSTIDILFIELKERINDLNVKVNNVWVVLDSRCYYNSAGVYNSLLQNFDGLHLKWIELIVKSTNQSNIITWDSF